MRHFIVKPTHEPADFTLAGSVNADENAAIDRACKKLCVTRADLVRASLQHIYRYLNDTGRLPHYIPSRIPSAERKNITVRLVLSDNDIVEHIAGYYKIARGEVLRRALTHYIETHVRNVQAVDQPVMRKPRAAQARGPEKVTVSVRLTPKQVKFMRAYAKVYEMTNSDVIAGALDTLRLSEVASSTTDD